jgi:cardiolipin synthase A/B
LDHVLLALFAASTAIISLAAACHALLNKRDSRAALGWMGISLTLPLLGPFLYWCMGINRISRQARRWKMSGRRVSGTRIYPIEEQRWESAQLPTEAQHLRDLRTLADRVVKTRLQTGNRIIPLEDGEMAYPAMLEAIGKAQISINLSSYIFDADGIGAEFVRLLKDAAARGVKVRVIIDALGEKYSRVSPFKLLDHSPVHIVRYLPLSDGAHINLRNHRKLLIIDGREAFTGGMNIRSRHMPTISPPDTAIHDMHFSVQGPVVNDLQRAFLKDWHFVTGEILDNPLFFPDIESQGSAVVRCISDGPDSEFRKLEQIITGALSCAESSVLIMTPYFIPDRPMVSALITAALRGVDVRIVLPSRNNLPFVHWASRAMQTELLANGVRVFYQPPPFIHSKLLLVDGVWTLIGSANWDPRSLRLNFELDLSIYDAIFAARMREHFDRAFLHTREVKLDEIENRTLPIKLRDSFFHLFSPYL